MTETYYTLEKVRFYRYRPSKETEIAESQNLSLLKTLGNDVKLRDGKTFGEKLRIVERVLEGDENHEEGEALDYPYIRYTGDKKW